MIAAFNAHLKVRHSVLAEPRIKQAVGAGSIPDARRSMPRAYRYENEAAGLAALHLDLFRLLLCFRALGQGHRQYPIFKAG
jgi:hypothetical protein